MEFWEYIKESLLVLLMLVILVGIPFLFYLIIKWDPIIGESEDEGHSLGLSIITVLWWTSLYFIWRYRSDRENLRDWIIKLLDNKDRFRDLLSDESFKKDLEVLDMKIREENWFGNYKGIIDLYIANEEKEKSSKKQTFLKEM